MATQELVIQEVGLHSLAEVNARYAEVAFLPSSPHRDVTLAGYVDRRLVALGRATRHADRALEVGGFWTDPEYRGRGFARLLVEAVLARVPAGARVYCLPFDELVPFYESFGMERVDPSEALPASIAAKRAHCKSEESAGRYQKTCVLTLVRA